MTYEQFWNHTPSEIYYWLYQMKQLKNRNLQQQANFTFWLAANITSGFNDPSKFPKSTSEAFPELFNEIRKNEDFQIERFKEGVRAFNDRRKR